MDLERISQDLESLLDQMLENQRIKVLEIARACAKAPLVEEDVWNPDDFQKLMQDPIFQYEEGISSGLLSAIAAIRLYFKDQKAGKSLQQVFQALGS